MQRVRNDFITLDRYLMPPSTRLRDLLRPTHTFTVEDHAGRSVVRVGLVPYGIAILQAT